MKFWRFFFAFLPAFGLAGTGLCAVSIPTPESLSSGETMYVIEREIPGAGRMTPAELRTASQKSCGVLRELGPRITWVQSYVTEDRLYCVYIAPNEEMIHAHAKKSGFPANAVSRVASIISPQTAE